MSRWRDRDGCAYPCGTTGRNRFDGDGQVSFVGTDAGVTFDYGYGKVATAWVGANDGNPVRDANGDGKASGNEIVFSTGGSDLQGLAAI